MNEVSDKASPSNSNNSDSSEKVCKYTIYKKKSGEDHRILDSLEQILQEKAIFPSSACLRCLDFIFTQTVSVVGRLQSELPSACSGVSLRAALSANSNHPIECASSPNGPASVRHAALSEHETSCHGSCVANVPTFTNLNTTHLETHLAFLARSQIADIS